MELIDVKPNPYAKHNEEFNEKDPRFEIGNHVRISEYKNMFAKGYTLTGHTPIGTFYEKELQKTNQE